MDATFNFLWQGSKSSVPRNVDDLKKDNTAVHNFQRLAAIVKNGDDSEIEIALEALPSLFRQSEYDALHQIVPPVCENLPQWTQDLQMKAGKVLLRLKKVELTPAVAKVISFSAVLVIQATSNITDSGAGQVFELFGDLAGMALPAMVWKSQDLANVLTIIDRYAESPFTEERRVAVAFLKGLCQCTSGYRAEDKPQIFDRLWKLAGDPSLDALAGCLDAIASSAENIAPLVLEEKVWPLIQRGWKNDPTDVASSKSLLSRSASVECAIAVCKSYDGEESTDTETSARARSKAHQTKLLELLPFIVDFVNHWSPQYQREVSRDIYAVEQTLARVLGQLALSLPAGTKNSALFRSFLEAFVNLASANGKELRVDSAVNMPAMSVIAIGDNVSQAIMLQCCKELSVEPSVHVRIAFAKGFHATVQNLATKETSSGLKEVTLALLNDPVPKVRDEVAKKLHKTLAAIEKADSQGWSTAELDTVVKLAAKSTEIPSNWRVAEEFINQCIALAETFTDRVDKPVMAALRNLYTHAKLGRVRVAAAKAVLTICRLLPDAEKRDYYIRLMLQDLRDGGSYHQRIMIILIAEFALDIFSQVIFERIFASPALDLADDDVSNVRLRLAKALPRFSPWCQGHELFEPAIAKLRSSTDPDIQRAMAGYVGAASGCIKLSRKNSEELTARRVAELEFYKEGGSKQSAAERKRITKASTLLAGIGPPLMLAASQTGRLGKKLASYSGTSKQIAEVETAINQQDRGDVPDEHDGESTIDSAAQGANQIPTVAEVELDEVQPKFGKLESAITWSADSADRLQKTSSERTPTSRPAGHRAHSTSSTHQLSNKEVANAAEDGSGSMASSSEQKHSRLSGLAGSGNFFARTSSSKDFLPKPYLPRGSPNVKAQAFPVQKLARAFAARRSSTIKPHQQSNTQGVAPVAPKATAKAADGQEQEVSMQDGAAEESGEPIVHVAKLRRERKIVPPLGLQVALEDDQHQRRVEKLEKERSNTPSWSGVADAKVPIALKTAVKVADTEGQGDGIREEGADEEETVAHASRLRRDGRFVPTLGLQVAFEDHQHQRQAENLEKEKSNTSSTSAAAGEKADSPSLAAKIPGRVSRMLSPRTKAPKDSKVEKAAAPPTAPPTALQNAKAGISEEEVTARAETKLARQVAQRTGSQDYASESRDQTMYVSSEAEGGPSELYSAISGNASLGDGGPSATRTRRAKSKAKSKGPAAESSLNSLVFSNISSDISRQKTAPESAEYDVEHIAAPASPVTGAKETAPAKLRRVLKVGHRSKARQDGPRAAGAGSTASRTSSPVHSPPASSYYEQEEDGSESNASQSKARKVASGLIAGLKGMAVRTGSRGVDTGGASQKAGASTQKSAQVASSDAENDKDDKAPPESYVPLFNGTPPWMREVLEEGGEKEAAEETAIAGPSSPTVAYSLDETSTAANAEGAIVPPGMVSGLVVQWSSLET